MPRPISGLGSGFNVGGFGGRGIRIDIPGVEDTKPIPSKYHFTQEWIDKVLSGELDPFQYPYYYHAPDNPGFMANQEKKAAEYRANELKKLGFTTMDQYKEWLKGGSWRNPTLPPGVSRTGRAGYGGTTWDPPIPPQFPSGQGGPSPGATISPTLQALLGRR